MVHPHVPVGIPCYDFTPVIDSLFNPHGGSSESLNSHGVTGGECKEQGHIHGGMADPPLLANPTSCSRVPDYNPNWGWFWGLAPYRYIATCCTIHCIVSDAPGIRAIMTWRHPLLPPRYRGSLVRHSN